ncbi:MAG: TolC family protein [Myxococcales bacterium]|nr:TolC family protein [Myxococcales bacterium]
MRKLSVIGLYLVLALASSEARAQDTGPRELTITLGITSSTARALAEAKTPTTSLTLQDLVEIALLNNAQVHVAAASIGEAEGLLSLARAQAFPSGRLTGLFGGPTPEAKTEVQNDPSTLTPASYEGDLNFGQLGIQLRLQGEAVQPLYTFEKISNLKKAAGHLVKAAEHNQTITSADVVVNVNKAFWTIQLTRTFVKSLDEGIGTLSKVLEKIEELLDADSPQVTENDRLRLKYALATLEVRRVEAAAVHEVAKQAMRLLLGWPQERSLEVVRQELDELPSETPRLEEVVAWARSSRPEIKALSEVVDAARSFEDYRKSAFFPDIFLGGAISAVYTSNATNQTNPFIRDPFNLFSVAVGLGIRVELDVFTKLAQLEQAKAQTRVKEAQAALVGQLVDLEVRKLHTEIVAGFERVQKLERANRTARGWLTASTLAYDIGTGEADELIDAFLAWAASEAELQTTRFNVLSKLVEMTRATGRLVGPDAQNNTNEE